MIEFDFSTYMRSIKKEDVASYQERIHKIKETLEKKESMLDWYDIETTISDNEVEEIINTSNYIKNNCDLFLVIGIGGSYLGAQAIISALSPYFSNRNPEILFVGTTLSNEYIIELAKYIKNRNVIVNVISLSGTTLETNMTFDIIYHILEVKYSKEELRRRIFITTNKDNGILKQKADKGNFKAFYTKNNIGGRFSCLTVVGLLPIAVASINIKELLIGAKKGKELINKACLYAVIRDIMYNNDKYVESFTIYEEKLLFFTEWLKQLFGETQGKDGKGILPISVLNTRDLHSLGQYFQDGKNIIFETVLGIKKEYNQYPQIGDLNNIVLEKVCIAHDSNHTPSNVILIDSLNEETLGELIYFFYISASVGGYLLNVNPFDQPGVNAYKDLIKGSL